jgi:sporulation protein YlmC with PRC-barrel domain
MIGEIYSLLGMKVYTDEGRFVGVVKDLVIDVERRRIKSIAISDYNKSLIDSDAKGVLIPYRLVKAVGDIVIVKDIFKRVVKEHED